MIVQPVSRVKAMTELPVDDSQQRQQEFQSALADATPAIFITPALIAINILVFVVMIIAGVSPVAPTGQQVAPWGANFGPLTLHGQWWRLLTSCFLHFGIIHLAFNMFILFQVGLFTEKLFGNLRFLLLYLLAGVGGNIVGLYFHPETISAGASGAIFGVYGGLLAFLLLLRHVVPSQSSFGIAKSAAIFILYNLIYGLAKPETDIAAHIGGLVTGFVCGCFLAVPLAPARERLHPLRTLAVAVGGVAIVAAAMVALPKRNGSPDEWSRLIIGGPRIAAGKEDQLVYSGTATKADAEKLAPALVKVGLLQKPGVILVLTKDASGSSLLIPLKGDETARADEEKLTAKDSPLKGLPIAHATFPWEDPVFVASIESIGPQLAYALGGPPLTIRLLNSKGETRKVIRIDTAEVVVGTRDRVSYSGTATAGDALALGQALRSCGFFRDLGTLVFLSKGPGGPELSYSMNNGSWDNPKAISFLENVSRRVAPSVGGPPMKVHLMDSTHQTRKELVIE